MSNGHMSLDEFLFPAGDAPPPPGEPGATASDDGADGRGDGDGRGHRGISNAAARAGVLSLSCVPSRTRRRVL